MSDLNVTREDNTRQYEGQGKSASQIIEWLKAGTANISVLKAIEFKVTVTDTTVFPQFTSDTTVIVNKSTATTQTISANNAITAGICVTLLNIGAGEVTVDFDGTANDATLRQGCAAKFLWTGSAWHPMTEISGSNANGNWTKHPSGVMTCFLNAVVISGANFSAPTYQTITFPIAFTAAPSVVATVQRDADDTLSVFLRFGNTKTATQFNVAHSSTAGAGVRMNYIANGFWK